MRILIVNSEHPPLGGGAGNASANIAREFVRLGEEVAILTTRYNDLPVDEVDDGIRIHRCLSIRKEASRSNPWEQLSFLLGACTDGLLFVKKWKPDVLITFFGVPSGPVGLLAKTFFKIPYIVSLRGGDVPGFRPYDFKRFHDVTAPIIRAVWNRAGEVIANSSGLQDLAESFESQAVIKVVPNGVDVNKYQAKEGYDGKPHMLFVGRVVHQKGLDILIDQLHDIQAHDWVLSIVGDGPERNPLKNQVRSQGMEERVYFLGWKERNELVSIYRHGNIFIFPSRHEGMPNAVLEAMASGLPVVASRIAGNEELVVHGKTGFLFPVDQPETLTDFIQKLITNPSLRKRMGTAARERVEEKYTWKRTAEAYLEIARQLVDM